MTAEDVSKKIQASATAQKTEASARIESLISEFGKKHSLGPDASESLRTLISAAIDEKLAEQVDVRIGRVLGSALAQM